MISITYRDISGVLTFLIWATLGLIAVKEFLKLMKIVGWGFMFEYTRLKDIKNPEHYKAVVRWKKVVWRLFLVWIISVIIIFSLGMWLNKLG
jgi:hypothetical protein